MFYFRRASLFQTLWLFSVLGLVALRANSSPAPASPTPAALAVLTEADQTLMTPTEAFIRLQEGNNRFRAGQRVARDWPAQVKATAHGQHPFASIVSCMDSRTAVEHVFDLGLGDVFSLRIAGNIINDDVLGSLEYAHKVAGAKLIVVLGHSHCGAMKGAADDVVLGNLTSLLARIKPAVVGVPADGKPGTSKNLKFVDDVGRLNVILAVRQIRERSIVLRELHDRQAIDIIGGFYDIETGKVEFYRPLVGATPAPASALEALPAPVADSAPPAAPVKSSH
jgi:carbonic anhydrase